MRDHGTCIIIQVWVALWWVWEASWGPKRAGLWLYIPRGKLGLAWRCNSNSSSFRISFKSYLTTGLFVGDSRFDSDFRWRFILPNLDRLKFSIFDFPFARFLMSVMEKLSFSSSQSFRTTGRLCLVDQGGPWTWRMECRFQPWDSAHPAPSPRASKHDVQFQLLSPSWEATKKCHLHT